jgi:hypothetical protein
LLGLVLVELQRLILLRLGLGSLELLVVLQGFLLVALM